MQHVFATNFSVISLHSFPVVEQKRAPKNGQQVHGKQNMKIKWYDHF